MLYSIAFFGSNSAATYNAHSGTVYVRARSAMRAAYCAMLRAYRNGARGGIGSMRVAVTDCGIAVSRTNTVVFDATRVWTRVANCGR